MESGVTGTAGSQCFFLRMPNFILSNIKRHKVATAAIVAASVTGAYLYKKKNKILYMRACRVSFWQTFSSAIAKLGRRLKSPRLRRLSNSLKFKSTTIDQLAADAIDCNSAKVLKIACKAGANINSIKGSSGLLRSMDRYYEDDSKELFKVILDAGADVNAADFLRRTPLHFTRQLTPEVVRLLLAKGARVDAADCNGCTPLHCIIKDCFNYDSASEIVRLYLKHGADAKLANGNKESPLQIAFSDARPNLEIINLLIHAGALYNNLPDLPNGKSYLRDSISNLDLERTEACIFAGANLKRYSYIDSCMSWIPLTNCRNYYDINRTLSMVKCLQKHGVSLNEVCRSKTLLDRVVDQVRSSEWRDERETFVILADELMKLGATSNYVSPHKLKNIHDLWALINQKPLAKLKEYATCDWD